MSPRIHSPASGPIRATCIRAKRGSSLVVVIVLIFALSLVVASLLKTLTNDKRMNNRIILAQESRNAAEGAVEVAVAELDRRAASYSTLSSTPLSDFTFPSDLKTFLASGNVNASSVDFKVGELSDLPSDPVIIDATDPFNAPDVDKGKPVSLRHAYIYGKASATDPASGQSVSSFVSSLVQVREQTWLNYAVFYNLDLEMHSGSDMDIEGPVHANQNVYLTAGAGSVLRFWGSLTTPKKIIRGYKYGGTIVHTGDVYCTPKGNPASGDLLTMGFGQDSNMTNFYSYADGRWNGFVQDESFGVPVFNPPGLLQYVQDDYTTSADETRNNAYAMIEPQLASVSTDNTSTNTYAGYKGDMVENQKFSAMAGLTIRVKPYSSWPSIPTDNPTDPGFELVYYQGSDSSRPVNRSNLPQRDGITNKPIEHVVDLTKMSSTLLTKLNDAIKIIKYDEVGSKGDSALVATDVDPTSGTDYRYGLYDRRQGYKGSSKNKELMGAHHTIQIDLGKFSTFINASDTEWIDQTDSTSKVYDPAKSYSGVVYVEIPLIPITDSKVAARVATDQIRPAVAPTNSTAGYAVVLRNCGVLPQLPSDPSRRDDGFTFASNGPVYIMGNYNADGSSGTGSSSQPDSSSEVPALIAADAVTVLSSSYTDDDMKNSATSMNYASFTEVSAGIIAGIVPTELDKDGKGKKDQWAGGVHNYVRFLENWTGVTYRYRGSLVCLFENEVSTAPWYQGEFVYWYYYPTRDLGYHTYFAQGEFPPGMPLMRTVRRISVEDINSTEYTIGPSKPPVASN